MTPDLASSSSPSKSRRGPLFKQKYPRGEIWPYLALRCLRAACARAAKGGEREKERKGLERQETPPLCVADEDSPMDSRGVSSWWFCYFQIHSISVHLYFYIFSRYWYSFKLHHEFMTTLKPIKLLMWYSDRDAKNIFKANIYSKLVRMKYIIFNFHFFKTIQHKTLISDWLKFNEKLELFSTKFKMLCLVEIVLINLKQIDDPS